MAGTCKRDRECYACGNAVCCGCLSREDCCGPCRAERGKARPSWGKARNRRGSRPKTRHGAL